VTGIRGVVFDLFDTLLYCTETGTRALALARAEQLGMTQETWRRGWGKSFELASRGELRTVEDRVRYALQEAGLVSPEPSLLSELVVLMGARDQSHLHSDVVSTLATLRARGYRLGLLSNIANDERDLVHDFGLDAMLDACVLSCDVGHAKPEAEVYALAAERLGLSPAACVFVDDRPSFVRAGQVAGMQGVRIARPDAWDIEEGDPGEAPVIASLDELLAWLPPR
jgi:putative hydrolase of the HAD superfamily